MEAWREVQTRIDWKMWAGVEADHSLAAAAAVVVVAVVDHS
jgi:hypothetical protein